MWFAPRRCVRAKATGRPNHRREMALAAALGTALTAAANSQETRQATVLEIDGAIGPAVADYVVRGLESVAPANTEIVVLRLDTPGGLDTSMREIIRAILASPVPVVAYVAPGGARAASAGTYIAYACPVAAMAPGTNIGAATPIQLGVPSLAPGGQPEQPSGSQGGEGKQTAPGGTSGAAAPLEPADTESRKILNDAVAYIRGLAELNGRNAEWATEAVRNAASLPASEALRLHVIDVIAADVPDLLRQIDGRSVTVVGKTVQLETAKLTVVPMVADWRMRFLAVVTDPNIAYLLMLLGAYGLIFELANPGAVLPGVVGGISLLMALFALNLLPIDYAGMALVLLGIALMVAEAFIGAFGVIGLGGVAAFAIGSVMMFHASAPGFGLSLSIVVAATLVSASFFLLVLAMLFRSRRRPIVTGREALIEAEGEAVEWHDEEGRVRVKGELWRARASSPLPPGTRVRVVGREGLILTVEPIR